MGIRRLTSDEAPSWSWDAANSIVQTRIDSGVLSRSATKSLTRSVTSKFQRSIPDSTDVWIDDAGGWLWCEQGKNSHVMLNSCFFPDNSDINQWATFVSSELSGKKLSWRTYGKRDSLVSLSDALNALPVDIVLRASMTGFDAPAGSSEVWLRAMGAGELTLFKDSIAQERAVLLVALGECTTSKEAHNKALRGIDRQLPDGVASPGHYLYELCREGNIVGDVWMENDSGTAIIHSIRLRNDERHRGYRRAALSTLVTNAHNQGVRHIQISVHPSDRSFLESLMNAGMEEIFTDYICDLSQW